MRGLEFSAQELPEGRVDGEALDSKDCRVRTKERASDIDRVGKPVRRFAHPGQEQWRSAQPATKDNQSRIHYADARSYDGADIRGVTGYMTQRVDVTCFGQSKKLCGIMRRRPCRSWPVRPDSREEGLVAEIVFCFARLRFGARSKRKT